MFVSSIVIISLRKRGLLALTNVLLIRLVVAYCMQFYLANILVFLLHGATVLSLTVAFPGHIYNEVKWVLQKRETIIRQY